MAIPKYDDSNNTLNRKETSAFSSSSYQTQQLLELDRLRKKYNDDDAVRQKAILDQLFEYKKGRINREYQLQVEAQVNLKKLEEKYAATSDKKEKKKLQARLDAQKKLLNTISKLEEAEEKKRAQREEKATAERILKLSKKERAEAGITDEEVAAAKKAFNATYKDDLGDKLVEGLKNTLASIQKQIDNQVTEISGYQSRIETRLYGTGKTWGNPFTGMGSKLSGIVGASPFIQTQKLFQNVDKLVDKGIAYNVEQRAFLATISEKIATTFDAANGTLLQLIRVQQSDTTAARLGMEASLTSYLNSMYQTTEYLTDAFDGVSTNIYEATSQMGSTMGVEFEYQVQKWLGSLYSVGMSPTSIQNLANAIGMLGSGNVSGLASSGMQNIIVMAASKMGKSYGELLTGGLDAKTTNDLLESIVSYLADIAVSDNKVVKSQLASIFGITVSDLTSTTNLISSSKDILNTTLSYNSAIGNLNKMADSMWQRTSVGEMMTNMWENIEYGISTGIATNPVLLAIWKVANTLEDTVGGIAIPMVSVLGNAVDLETTVADLMQVGAISGGLLSSLGNMIVGLAQGSGGGFSGSGMLRALGVKTGVSTISRGSSLATTKSGATVSQSSYTSVGNTAGGDIYDASMAGATNQKSSLMAEAKESEETTATLDIVDGHVVDIYNLLSSVISGNTLNVKVDNYGLSIN